LRDRDGKRGRPRAAHEARRDLVRASRLRSELRGARADLSGAGAAVPAEPVQRPARGRSRAGAGHDPYVLASLRADALRLGLDLPADGPDELVPGSGAGSLILSGDRVHVAGPRRRPPWSDVDRCGDSLPTSEQLQCDTDALV